jgi:hypothetical protein
MSDWQSLGGVFTSPPHIVCWGQANRQAFVFAVGTDQALWYRHFDGVVTWSAWQSLGGVVMSPPYAVKSGDSSVDVFAVGANSELLHWHFQDPKWTEWPIVETAHGSVERRDPHRINVGLYQNWESLGGILVSPPHAVMFGELNNVLSVFALGTDHAVWFRELVNGSWKAWDTLPGPTLTSSPHAVTWQQETLLVFALGTDEAVWCWTNTGWTSLGGTFSSPPFAVSTPQHVHVFATGTQSQLRHRRWTGSQWDDWESFGGILLSPPQAVNVGDEVVEVVTVYTVGTDSAAWKVGVFNDGPSAWQSLGGVLTSSPHAAFTENLLTFVVGLQADHGVWLLVDR